LAWERGWVFFSGEGIPHSRHKNLTREGDGIMEEKGTFGGFEPIMMNKDVLKLMRFSFDVAFYNMTRVQDFNMKLLKDMLENSKVFQAEAVQLISDFIESARKGRDEYKKMITEGFQKVGEMLAKKS
jgi:polyhydroxyalkanoate synthesis regulator phasin